MSLQFIDGFDAQDALTKYSPIGSIIPEYTGPTRFGDGSCLTCSGASAGGFGLFTPITASAQVFFGAAFKATGAFSSASPLVTFFGDSGAQLHVVIQLNTSGALQILRGATVLATSAAGIIVPGAWNYLEASATISDTVGAVTVKLNGTTVVSFTGDTKNAGTGTNIDAVQIGVRATGYSMTTWWDDLYICNGLGTVNNTFLGDVRVQTLHPNGAGSKTELSTVGSANNWQNVDESALSNSDYNYSTVAGKQDLYALDEVLGGTSEVLGVQVAAVARKTDSGARGIKTLVKSGATTTAGPTVMLGVTQSTARTLHESNPTTAAAWTVSDMAALEAGAEVV